MSRNFATQRDFGVFAMNWVDFDKNPPPVAVLAAMLEGYQGDFLLYNTRGATPDNLKSRLLLKTPPATGQSWLKSQRLFNLFFKAKGVETDAANERFGQLCYLPNRGAHYETYLSIN
jgi:hypothetical protein